MTPTSSSRKRGRVVKAWAWKMRNNGRLSVDGEFPVRAIPPDDVWLYSKDDGGFVEVEIRELPKSRITRKG